MSTTKTLTPGTWCKPYVDRERDAVLELGGSLGLYEDLMHGTLDDGVPLFVSFKEGPTHKELEVSTPDFVAAMFAEAERRRGMLEDGDRIYAKGKPEIWQDHEQRIKALEKLSSLVEYHNRQVDRLDSHMMEAEQRLSTSGDVINSLLEYRNSDNRRLEGLEKALDEHLQKERKVELSDLDLLGIIIERKRALLNVRNYEQASWFRDVERALIKACGIPEGAIVGMSPNPNKEQ